MVEIFTVNISIIPETMSDPKVVREILGVYVSKDLLPQIADYAAITDITFDIVYSIDMAIWPINWPPEIDTNESVSSIRRTVVEKSITLDMVNGQGVPYFNFYYYDGEPHILSEDVRNPTHTWKQLLVYAKNILKKYRYESTRFVIMIDPDKGDSMVRDAITLVMSVEDKPTLRLISSPIPGSDQNVLILGFVSMDMTRF